MYLFGSVPNMVYPINAEGTQNPPIPIDFILLNGQDFYLLDGTQFLLIGQ